MISKVKSVLEKLLNTGFFHIFSSSVINKVISFASGIILVRILTKPEYGIYTYANNILSFCKLASGFGIVSAMLQICSESKDPIKRNLIYSYCYRFGATFNLLLAGIILGISILFPLPIEGSNFCLSLMCGIPLFHVIYDLQITNLRTELKTKEYAYSNTISTILTFAFSCGLSFFLREQGLILAQYLSLAIAIILIGVLFKTNVSFKKVTLDSDIKKSLFSIGGVSMANNGLSQLMYLLDVFVLGIVLKDESIVASYKIATTIPTALTFIPLSVIIYVYPYFARNKNNKRWLISNYKKLTAAMGFVNLVIGGLLFALAPFIIRIVFGAQYLDAVEPFRILSISYIFSGTFRIIGGNLLVTQRKLTFNLIIAAISGALNTVLNVFFIITYGSVGAAIATIITVIFTSVLNTWYLIRTFKRIPEKETN